MSSIRKFKRQVNKKLTFEDGLKQGYEDGKREAFVQAFSGIGIALDKFVEMEGIGEKTREKLNQCMQEVAGNERN